MRKAISPIISVSLLILIVIAASAGAYYWINNMQSRLESQVGKQAEELTASECSELQLISVRGNGVIVSNMGCDTINNINMFIDDKLTQYDLNQPLQPGDSVNIGFSSLEEGETHTVTIAIGNGKVVSDSVEDCGIDQGCSTFNFTLGGVEYS